MSVANLWMILVWLATLEMLSLASWPLVRRALPGAVDRGWAASRIVGPLLLSLAIGAAAQVHLLPYTRAALVLLSLAGGGLAWVAWRPRLEWPRRWPARNVVIGEAVFLVAFAAALGLRALFPSVDNNERPMDFAFLSAFVRADGLPPTDPWFAGQSIAYYTFGYLGWANVTRLAGVPVEVAYNLAVASVFAGAVALAWATAAAYRGRLVDGFLAATTIALVGNLRTLVDWLMVLGLGTPEWWAGWAVTHAVAAPGPGWVFWMQASRVIPNSWPEGITEFPFFSLVVGDLHPHYMAMAANILVVSLALAGLRGGPLALLVPLAAATLAGLAAGNTWNVPAAAALLGLALVARFWWPRRRPRRAVAVLGALVLATVSLTAPLLVGISSPPLALAWTPGPDRLWPGTFTVLFLPYALGLGAALAAQARPWRGWPLVLAGLLAGCVLAEVLAQAGVATLLAGALVGLVLVAWRALGARQSLEAGLLATCAIAVGLVLVPEFVFLSDYFGTRMNTVFKFYSQALLFLGVALPPLLASLPWPRLSARRARPIRLLRKAALYTAALTLVYVPLAPFMRMAVSPAGGTLDGLAFLQTRAPDDLATIEWLRAVAPPGAAILEAADREDPTGPTRSDFARVSAFSGIPTLLGWVGHEQQWRGRVPSIDQRLQQVNEVYQDGSLDEAAHILERYGIEYVVVGEAERATYGPAVESRFQGWLEPAFQAGQTTVYRVPDRLLETGPGTREPLARSASPVD